ncbi:hypothetical protein COV54_02290 [Candidatus Jorgensenbacteria bacterium CG11_big_fil_rev_8_21_14_0_20_38_23]|uniref:Uncharacterized protein n=1 Tax=Candidatus Jorgensenbacteria bacterium CG11_big_fil_rev_8_21_14_0_20_38_23 TaxID=1974594 RepID=A0A2H0NEU6_9BACT|nr:MAG: hypothetical protein COV54_02290 [Candidatus Jorgensenbacteria bacterium CG11_big_fil_rev_8_21_14_0_20_38_23]
MNEKGQRIIVLRKRGKTHSEIAKILKIPKSTVGWWLKGVKMPKAIRKKILEKSREKWRKNIQSYNKYYGKIRSQEAAKIREGYKEQGFQEISKEIKKLSKRNLKLIGTALYWAEGNTKNRNRLQFGNSNSLMIGVVMRFFREICNIAEDKIKARVHIYPGINYRKALSFWSQITKLPKSNFYPPQIQVSRASKGKRLRNTLPYGTLHLTVNNTELACRVKGWIQGISEKI